MKFDWSLIRGVLMAAATLAAGVPASAQQPHLPANGNPYLFTLSYPDEAWFLLDVGGGRSYCVETTFGVGSANGQDVDTVLSVYGHDGSPLIGTNDDAVQEPYLRPGSRVCFLTSDTTFQTYYAKVTVLIHPSPRSIEIRLVETTLFSPWFLVASTAGYDAAPQIRNTTENTIHVRFRARDTSGAVLPGCPTSTATLPPNGMLTFAVSQWCGTSSAFGSADIAHDGTPGSVQANTTTFSAASGLSFDAPFAPRER